MARGKAPIPNWLTPTAFSDYFQEKISEIKRNFDPSLEPVFAACPSNCSLYSLKPVSIESVTKLILKLPNKSSVRDLLPVHLVKECIHLLAPFITYMLNLSLSTGSFPDIWKFSVINPILKKDNLDPSQAASYRPIAKLPLLSKVLERIVSAQLRIYLQRNDLFPQLQSAYRQSHSTETSILKITSDILLSLDQGHLCLLTMLDLSAAFDSIDLEILIRRLNIFFGLTGTALKWFNSFVSGRHQSVQIGSSSSQSVAAECGVPQGSVLGPLLFILYMSDVTQIAMNHDFNIHLYADDVQIYSSCAPSQCDSLSTRLSCSLDDIISWFHSNQLYLNTNKCETIWFHSSNRRSTAPSSAIRIGSSHISPVSSVRCLGVHLDSELSFNVHLTKRSAACYAAMRQIRSIRSSIPAQVLKMLVSSLVISRLDYCISVLSGVPACRLKRLQSVLNAAARLIHGSSRYCAITPLLKDLRWLPVEFRVKYRLCLLAFCCNHDMAPNYLINRNSDAASTSARSRLRSANAPSLSVRLTRRPTLGGRSFVVAAAHSWNNLPSHLRSIDSFPQFKRQVKDHFYHSCFS